MNKLFGFVMFAVMLGIAAPGAAPSMKRVTVVNDEWYAIEHDRFQKASERARYHGMEWPPLDVTHHPADMRD